MAWMTMGTELRVRRQSGFSAKDIEPLMKSEHYRGFDERFKHYLFGYTGQASGHPVPEYTLWFEGDALGITDYAPGPAWDELSAFVRGLSQTDATVRIVGGDDEEDMSSYFEAVAK